MPLASAGRPWRASPSAGVFHLFANGDFVAGSDDSGDVIVGGVPGHPAHGDLVRRTFAAGGQNEIKRPGCEPGIIIKHLIEIAEAK